MGLDRLDTHCGVDALLQTPERNIALAVRLRGFSYLVTYGDITIRYDSLQNLGKALEMQKSIARFMFYGCWMLTAPIRRRWLWTGTWFGYNVWWMPS